MPDSATLTPVYALVGLIVAIVSMLGLAVTMGIAWGSLSTKFTLGHSETTSLIGGVNTRLDKLNGSVGDDREEISNLAQRMAASEGREGLRAQKPGS